MKILVVDDDASIRRVIRRVVRTEFNAEVCEAEDGLDALDRLRAEPFDLVVLDIGMKILDGVQALEAMRRVDAFAELPVIIVSGTADRESALRLRGLKVLGAIVKPFTPATLQQRLRKIIEQIPKAPAREAGGGRLELRPSTRVFAVGPDDERRAAVTRLLDHVCDVAAFTSAAGALREAVARPPDVVLLTGVDPLLPPALFAATLQKEAARPTRVIQLGEGGGTESGARVPLHVVPAATEPAGVLESLRPFLTDGGIALALLNHRAAAVDDLFEQAQAAVASTGCGPVGCQTSARAWSLPDERSFEATAIVRVNDLSWALRVLLTHGCALEYARKLSHLDVDRVSDTDLVEVTKAFACQLITNLSAPLLAFDLQADYDPPTGGAARQYGSLARSVPVRSQARWITDRDGLFKAAVVFSADADS